MIGSIVIVILTTPGRDHFPINPARNDQRFPIPKQINRRRPIEDRAAFLESS